MEESLKVQDCVEFMHGYTPKMTISSIDEATQMATCVWFDSKTKKTKTEVIPLNVLKKSITHPKINKDDLISAIYRR